MNNKINRIHERSLRIIYNSYTSSFEDLLKKDNSINIHQRNIHSVAIEMYKVKNDLCPPFFKVFFQLNTATGPSTRRRNTFKRSNVRTVKGENSLRIFGPIVWNDMLPDNIKRSSSLIEFKRLIKSWVPENCPCNLCKTYLHGVGYL